MALHQDRLQMYDQQLHVIYLANDVLLKRQGPTIISIIIVHLGLLFRVCFISDVYTPLNAQRHTEGLVPWQSAATRRGIRPR